MLIKQLLQIQEALVGKNYTHPDWEAKARADKKGYSESSDFDADYDTLIKHLKDAKKIVESANWKKHMKDTDDNFDTDCVTYSQDALKSLNEAIAAFEEFYDHIQEAA